ncbi:MAG: NUDIX domain-containing protein [Erysipelotrichales bacterium]|nr:NUDIX domain-containing protein [Erysipelotrichales bacterium]
MEYLDIYDENGNHLGKEERSVVHALALWHKTVHCWLFDKEGNIYFQIRKDEGTFYTTGSGHIQAGESVKEGFYREIKEEIGIEVDIDNCILVDVVNFVMDRSNKDGSVFRDRAFANVYICDFEESIDAFKFDTNEVKGLVKMTAKDVLALISSEVDSINATYIVADNDKNISYEETVTRDNFLVNPGETILGKYGDVVRKVIEVTSK